MPAARDCPGSECWQALFNDTAPADQRERFERHLESCPACQGRLDRAEERGDPLLRLARRFGDPTIAPADPTLGEVLGRLLEGKSLDRPASAKPADLYFLRPAGRPGVLGVLGGYEVHEVIALGGMGVVLRAFDPALHRLVAIKVLAPALAGSATARRRFTREAQAAAAVCHDHVVAVHGVSEADGLPYFVMQYVAGESLQARLSRTGPLELEEVVRIGMQAASGLAAAHVQGLIHRDVKPANLLLEGGLARVKITDFGLARTADGVQLTQAGVVAGTPEYMAPEQARGEQVDRRADLFSLGSVLYACCTGVPPFRGATPLAVLRRVSDETPAPIRSLNPDVPAWLEALVARLLAKDPADRLQSAAEVASLLERYLAHLRQPTAVPAPELPPPAAGARPGPWGPRPQTAPVKQFPQRLWLPALVLLAALGLSLFLAAQALAPGGESQHEVAYDFQGRPLPPGMVPFGPLEERFIQVEAEGLRISVPRDRDNYKSVGLSMPLTLQGDFEITTAFEILQADEPAPGTKTYGTGVLMSVNEDARVGRLVRAQGWQVATWDRWATVEGNRKFLYGASPARGKSGRLRLKRAGTTLHFLWAPETEGDNFEEINQCEFGALDITLLRVELNTDLGRKPGALDLRLLDLKIRSATPVADQVVASGEGGTTRSIGWLVAAGLIGLAVLLSGIALWVGLWVRRRRAGKAAGRAAVPCGQAKPQAAQPSVSFPCPGCGKRLKVKAELAGKNAKCPHCGKPGLVPAIMASPPPRPIT
jgi:serine/threonine protein kinase